MDDEKKNSTQNQKIKTDEYSYLKSRGLDKDFPPIWKQEVKQNFDAKFLELKKSINTNDEDAVLKEMALEFAVDKRILKRFKENGFTNLTGYATLFNVFRFVRLKPVLRTQELFEAAKDDLYRGLNLTYGHVDSDYMKHEKNISKGFALIEELWDRKRNYLDGINKPTEKIAAITKLNKFVTKKIEEIEEHNLVIYLGKIPSYLQPPIEKGNYFFKGYMILLLSYISKEHRDLLPGMPKSKDEFIALNVDWSRNYD